MKSLALTAVLWLAAVPAYAAPAKRPSEEAKGLSLEEVNKAVLSGKPGKGVSAQILKAQVLLDRARFSPGVIDGRDGENLRKAVAAYERAQNLKPDGALDPELWAKLSAAPDPVLVEYTIAQGDVKGPFVEKIPPKMEDLAALDRLGFAGPEEALSEKFHMDPGLLRKLNPGKSFGEPGTVIVVASVAGGEGKAKAAGKLARIEVDKKRREVRALGKDGALIAVYPASIGSAEKPAPSGSHSVRTVAENPVYTYNPDYRFKGVKATQTFEIKPGPNNPVGVVWIDLSLESYGIHGTPEPAKVGKTYSHGCVRLTNWDALELAKMVEKGTPVEFVD